MTELCRLDALDATGSLGLTADLGDGPEEIFVVRHGDMVRAYRNSCPHTGGPLEWLDHQFLDDEGAFIVCATHGALFRIEDGFCFAGPCKRQSLSGIPVRVEDNRVVLA
ncbi:(2Fe-2S)-binding protein [Thioalkalivibrio denitrificans]|uniref:(2Fe-2S)-binding protein n=1 Tax=Thioalkalivibrio denitrificans TaxID=108003 RepID=A0A1V3NKW6_9GAMM|nr:Rieske (2Fe-2S) protein [Thioalkalivibrio denitrificans]OOG25700.1 (2Fe-2S)-binding protein [Thioalkalivibrio denitrificans]